MKIAYLQEKQIYCNLNSFSKIKLRQRILDLGHVNSSEGNRSVKWNVIFYYELLSIKSFREKQYFAIHFLVIFIFIYFINLIFNYF